MRGLKIIALVLGGVLAALVALAIYVATLDLSSYKADIEQAVEEATGRALTISGELDLAWRPGPTITASGLRLANAAGESPGARADSMATVGELSVSVGLWPLLSGRIDVTNMTLRNLLLRLERDADGAGNWQGLAAAADGAAAEAEDGDRVDWHIRSVSIEESTVTWRSGPDVAEESYRIDGASLTSGDNDEALDLYLTGELDGLPIALNGTVPALSAWAVTGRDLDIRLEGEVDGTDTALDATLLRTVANNEQRIEAKQIMLGHGGIRAKGSAALTLVEPRPRLVATLSFEPIDLDAVGDDGEAGRLPVAPLRAVDGEIKLAIPALRAEGYTISDIKLVAVLRDAVLEVRDLTGRLADGAIEATGRLDASGDTLRLAVDGRLIGTDLGALVQTATGEDALVARGDITASLTARGDDRATLIRTLDGRAASIVRKGVLRNDYWELIAEDLATSFLPSLGETDRGTLNCAVAAYDIEQGRARIQVLLIDSSRVTVAGEGSINLVSEVVEIRLVPQPKDPALISLATPILINGPLEDPTVAPDPVAVAKDVGKAVVGTAINPLGLLLPFIDSGSGEDPCPGAIAIAEGRQPAASSGGSGGGKPGAIEGFFNKLRKAIE